MTSDFKFTSTPNAFTLAEVLITLGIIGVVAAMTMPTLMNSTNGAQYKTAYKKALSVISQAVVMNVALDDFDMSQASETGTTGQSLYSMFKNRMNVIKTGTGTEYKLVGTGNVKNTKANFGGDTANDNYTLYFNDGITFTFPQSAKDCAEISATNAAAVKCYGLIDTNGEKSPNKVVQCDNSTSGDSCEVTNPTDIYPVVFYDQSILPATDAGRAVLYGK